MRSLLLVVLGLSSASLAAKPGDTFYVVAPGAPLLKDAKANAAAVTRLKAGDAVTWSGPSEKDKSFMAVLADGKKGFLPRSALTPFKPQDDALPPSQPAPVPFAQSGAATKDGPRPQDAKTTAELDAVEKLNQRVGEAELSAKARELNGGK